MRINEEEGNREKGDGEKGEEGERGAGQGRGVSANRKEKRSEG